MFAILHLLVMFVADIFMSRRRLEAENLFLRHQLNIALRRAAARPRLRLYGRDRALSGSAPQSFSDRKATPHDFWRIASHSPQLSPILFTQQSRTQETAQS